MMWFPDYIQLPDGKWVQVKRNRPPKWYLKEVRMIAAMAISCTKGTKGRLKASGKEFEIVEVSSNTSTIRFRYENTQHELSDDELRQVAEQIDGWSSK